MKTYINSDRPTPPCRPSSFLEVRVYCS